MARPNTLIAQTVEFPIRRTIIEGDLRLPGDAVGLVVFAHGSGSSRFSSRNRAVAHTLESRALGTLLLDLLTRDEDAATR
jgi:putative phosphoribosyl transferase